MTAISNKGEQRVIKFRAWHMNLLEMERDVHVLDRFAEILAWPEKYVVMQFTGLKDKNRVEIYEGDLLKFFDKVIAVVVFQSFGGWSYEWIDPTYKTIRQYNPEPFFRNINLWEVVGNIYEHPELLHS